MGLIQSVLLNERGISYGDSALESGQIAVVDLGHLTVDVCVVRNLVPVPESLTGWELGSAKALEPIRQQLSVFARRDLTLYETDQAIRAGTLSISGKRVALPADWDAPLRSNAKTILSMLKQVWGTGTQFDAILIGGGGAELEAQVEVIKSVFPDAEVVQDPQLAIPEGYARLGQRLLARA